MKLTKGKLAKLYRKIKQTAKKYKKNRGHSKNKSFRKKKPLNLKNRSLKRYYGGVIEEPKIETPSEETPSGEIEKKTILTQEIPPMLQENSNLEEAPTLNQQPETTLKETIVPSSEETNVEPIIPSVNEKPIEEVHGPTFSVQPPFDEREPTTIQKTNALESIQKETLKEETNVAGAENTTLEQPLVESSGQETPLLEQPQVESSGQETSSQVESSGQETPSPVESSEQETPSPVESSGQETSSLEQPLLELSGQDNPLPVESSGQESRLLESQPDIKANVFEQEKVTNAIETIMDALTNGIAEKLKKDNTSEINANSNPIVNFTSMTDKFSNAALKQEGGKKHKKTHRANLRIKHNVSR
jgi:hypothetical protein